MPATSSVTPSGISYIDYVDGGIKWAVNSFTYSFPSSASFYVGFNGGPYGTGEPSSGFKAFNAVQQSATASILNLYSAVANVTFTPITESSTQSADLRYAESSQPSTAWGYYPSTSPEGGDAWFSSSGLYDNPKVGNYAWLTIIHETGHLLGLKHPQDVMGSFGAVPASVDSVEYSVMSYRSYIGASTTQGFTNATWSFPTTLMMYDIAALQYMYGANYSTNSGDTVYKWNPTTGQETINGVAQAAPGGNTVFMTVWDGGGNDTYDFSNYTTNVSVNLQPGAWTTTSTAQLANLGNGHTAVGNIANSYLYNNNPASLIENVIGGAGNDAIVGNAADNKFTGGAGNDTLDGVSGVDTAVYSGSSTSYSVTQNADGSWTVADLRTGSPDGTDTLKNVEFLQFSDKTVAIGTVTPPPTIAAPAITTFSPDTASASDGITAANVLTLTGTAQANSTVKVYDGVTLLGTALATSGGAWSFTTAAMADGSHSFTATATDGSGNTSASSAVMPVIVDTVAPVTPTISLQSVDSGIAGDGITKFNVISLTGTAEINTTVKIYDGATLLGSAVANAEGVWNFVADVTNDQIAAPAAVAGVHGEVGPRLPVVTDSGSAFSIYDAATGALVGTATSAVDGGWSFLDETSSKSLGAPLVETTGTASANGPLAANATAPNQTQAWGFTTGALPDGVHNFTVSSTDAAGNVSATSAVLSITVDTAAPVAPTVTSFSADSGVAGDGITNDNTLTFTGTAEAGSTVKVYDGATLLGSVTANGSGAWSYTTAALANGGHSFTATATDLAGNTGVASSALAVTVDTAAPGSPVISSISTDSGAAGDGITNDNTLTIAGTAEAGSTVKLYDSATLLGSVTANGSGAWSYTTVALANGGHSFTATATDLAGNTGVASSALAVTVDTAAPVAPVISTGTMVNGNDVALSGTAEAGSTIKLYDGATLLGSVTANGSGAWSYTTAALANGGHSFTATATDLAGNTGVASSALAVAVDTAAPVAPVISSFSADGGVAGDGITNDNTLTLTGTAEAGSTVKLYDGLTLLGGVTASGSGTWSYTTAALANGGHSFTATATDLAGNTGVASSALAVTVDTAAPGSPVISSISTDSGVAGDGITNDNTLTLAGTAEAGSTIKLYDGATLLGSATANGSGAWSYTTGTLANGGHSFTATATDLAGNTGLASSALAVTVDTTAPGSPVISSISTDSGVAGDGITNDNTLTLAGTAEAGSTVKLYDGATLLGSVTANGSGAWSYTTAALANGGHSFTATATDLAGNTGVASAALAVTIDTAAPVAPTVTSFSTDSGVAGDGITNDNTLTLSGTAEAGSTIKLYDGATLLGSAIVNGSGAWSYATAALANGGHSFTATATDLAGNTGVASAALAVTIDTAAPVAPTVTSFSTDSGAAGDGITSDNTLTIAGTAEAGSTVKLYDGATLLGSVTANGSGAWSYTTGTLANGGHNFTATATDLAGNTGLASSALAVTVDTTAPVAPTVTSFSTDSGVAGDGITNDNTLTLAGTAEAGSTVKLYDGATLLGSVTANGSGAWSYTTGTLANGGHSFTATATDLAGNTGGGSPGLNVTVDTAAPVAPVIASGVVVNGNDVALAGTAEAGSTVKLFDGATVLGSVTANGSGAWSYTTAALANGGHSFTATATDPAGNTGVASSALAVTVDTTALIAPTVTSFSTDSGVAGDHITNDNTPTLTGAALANSTVTIFDGTRVLGTTVANAGGAWSFTSGVLADGGHSLSATVTDASGNSSFHSASLGLTIDTTAPATPVAGVAMGTGSFAYLSGTADAGSTVSILNSLNSTLVGTTVADAHGAWSFMKFGLTPTSFSLSATDTAGNSSPVHAAVSGNGPVPVGNGLADSGQTSLGAPSSVGDVMNVPVIVGTAPGDFSQVPVSVAAIPVTVALTPPPVVSSPPPVVSSPPPVVSSPPPVSPNLGTGGPVPVDIHWFDPTPVPFHPVVVMPVEPVMMVDASPVQSVVLLQQPINAFHLV